MEDVPFEGRLREIARLIGEGATKEDILAKGFDLKDEMSHFISNVSMSMNTLDQMIFGFTRESSWVFGWWTFDQAIAAASTPMRPPRYDRTKKTHELAAALAPGKESVRVSDIIEGLRKEGEDLPERPLATAVGNILTRSGNWRRLQRGEYVPISGSGAIE